MSLIYQAIVVDACTLALALSRQVHTLVVDIQYENDRGPTKLLSARRHVVETSALNSYTTLSRRFVFWRCHRC